MLGRRWLILTLSSLLFICSQFYRVANAVIAPQLQRDFGLSSEALGMLSAVFFYAFAAAQVPLALFLDRVGARWSMGILSLLGALGAWVFACANSLDIAILGRVILGLGMSGNLMGSMKLIGHWFSAREFATLSGVLFAAGTLGNMFAATPLAVLVEALGWRWAFALTGAGTALLAAIFLILVRERPAPEPRPAGGGRWIRPSVGGMLKALLFRREYWLISFGTFFRYGTFVAIQGLWAGPYLLEGVGLSSVETGNLLLALSLGVVVGAPLWGWLSDRVICARKPVVIMGLAVMAFSELCLAQGWAVRHVGALAAVMAMLGLSSSTGHIMYAHMKERVPAHMTGMALTGVNLFTMLGPAVLLHAMGWIVDRRSSVSSSGAGPYEAAFFAAFLGVLLSLGMYLFTRERKPQDTPPFSSTM